MACYTAAAALDSTFWDAVSGSRTGKVSTDFASGADRAFAVALQSDGKIVVAGEANAQFAVARYLGRHRPPPPG